MAIYADELSRYTKSAEEPNTGVPGDCRRISCLPGIWQASCWQSVLSPRGKQSRGIQEAYLFAFLATYSSAFAARHLPLSKALAECGDDQKKLLELLATVSKAAESSRFVARLVESGEIFHPLQLSARDAYEFLKEVPLYEPAGILCRIPKWWKNTRHSVRLSVNIGSKQPSHLGAGTLLDFDAGLFAGEEPVSPAELRQWLEAAEGLAFNQRPVGVRSPGAAAAFRR